MSSKTSQDSAKVELAAPSETTLIVVTAVESQVDLRVARQTRLGRWYVETSGQYRKEQEHYNFSQFQLWSSCSTWSQRKEKRTFLRQYLPTLMVANLSNGIVYMPENVVLCPFSDRVANITDRTKVRKERRDTTSVVQTTFQRQVVVKRHIEVWKTAKIEGMPIK